MSDNREDFNALVDMAMANPGLSAMRPVVEKELLHYEIFQALDAEGLLKGLVFQGGTSLRLCRGSDRFSEDLDFAGGKDFSADSMQEITACMKKRIGQRFGLKVAVNHKPSGVGEDGIKTSASASGGYRSRQALKTLPCRGRESSWKWRISRPTPASWCRFAPTTNC